MDLLQEIEQKHDDRETAYFIAGGELKYTVTSGESAAINLTRTDKYFISELKDAIMTHNHPILKRHAGTVYRLGASFSNSDLKSGYSYGLAEVRAFTEHRVYSIRPADGKRWPSSSLIDYHYHKTFLSVDKEFPGKPISHLIMYRLAKLLGLVYTVRRNRPLVTDCNEPTRTEQLTL